MQWHGGSLKLKCEYDDFVQKHLKLKSEYDDLKRSDENLKKSKDTEES